MNKLKRVGSEDRNMGIDRYDHGHGGKVMK